MFSRNLLDELYSDRTLPTISSIGLGSSPSSGVSSLAVSVAS